jgi:hypothetical protein
MNSLSWLIYIANVSVSLGGFFTFLAVVCGFAAVVVIIIITVCVLDTDYYGRSLPNDQLAKRDIIHKGLKKTAIITATGMFLFGTFSTLMPDRETILLIAASEIGEKVVQTEQVKGVFDPSVELLKTWISQQTQSIKSQMSQQTDRITDKK